MTETTTKMLTLDEARVLIGARLKRNVTLKRIAAWANEGRLDGAVRVQTGSSGYAGMRWLVPASTVQTFEPPKRGRPFKKRVRAQDTEDKVKRVRTRQVPAQEPTDPVDELLAKRRGEIGG